MGVPQQTHRGSQRGARARNLLSLSRSLSLSHTHTLSISILHSHFLFLSLTLSFARALSLSQRAGATRKADCLGGAAPPARGLVVLSPNPRRLLMGRLLKGSEPVVLQGLVTCCLPMARNLFSTSHLSREAYANPHGRITRGSVNCLISHNVFLKTLCESQFPDKRVNLFLISEIVKDKLTDLCGNRLLQNDFINTFCEIKTGADQSTVWSRNYPEKG